MAKKFADPNTAECSRRAAAPNVGGQPLPAAKRSPFPPIGHQRQIRLILLLDDLSLDGSDQSMMAHFSSFPAGLCGQSLRSSSPRRSPQPASDSGPAPARQHFLTSTSSSSSPSHLKTTGMIPPPPLWRACSPPPTIPPHRFVEEPLTLLPQLEQPPTSSNLLVQNDYHFFSGRTPDRQSWMICASQEWAHCSVSLTPAPVCPAPSIPGARMCNQLTSPGFYQQMEVTVGVQIEVTVAILFVCSVFGFNTIYSTKAYLKMKAAFKHKDRQLQEVRAILINERSKNNALIAELKAQLQNVKDELALKRDILAAIYDSSGDEYADATGILSRPSFEVS